MPPHLQVAVFAHELQHALEVARAPHVVDATSFERLYRHIGTRARCGACFDTKEATRAGQQVFGELRRVVATD